MPRKKSNTRKALFIERRRGASKKKKKKKQNPQEQNCNDGDEEQGSTCSCSCGPHQGGDDEDSVEPSISSNEAAATTAEAVTDTRSSVTAHSIRNYLMGISREAGPDQHPLIPDVPSEWLEYLEIASR
mmetsp:Transcript_13397/g.27717  ORF Transcript_13397/g.27717 Transcript_13397/m.27717 type:complete len:128 (-) Transcript_13397:271-654(-)